MNVFARGETPIFLQPLLAGGVSIALQKNATVVRPLSCGDPLRRLVAKCFCLGAKTQISSVFRGKNYGVGCRGDVEVVDHSLRDVLCKYRPREALEPTADDLDTIKPIGEALDHAKLTEQVLSNPKPVEDMVETPQPRNKAPKHAKPIEEVLEIDEAQQVSDDTGGSHCQLSKL